MGEDGLWTWCEIPFTGHRRLTGVAPSARVGHSLAGSVLQVTRERQTAPPCHYRTLFLFCQVGVC